MNDKFRKGDRVQLVPMFLGNYDDEWIDKLSERVGKVTAKRWGRYWVAFPGDGERLPLVTDFHSLELQHAED